MLELFKHNYINDHICWLGKTRAHVLVNRINECGFTKMFLSSHTIFDDNLLFDKHNNLRQSDFASTTDKQ